VRSQILSALTSRAQSLIHSTSLDLEILTPYEDVFPAPPTKKQRAREKEIEKAREEMMRNVRAKRSVGVGVEGYQISPGSTFPSSLSDEEKEGGLRLGQEEEEEEEEKQPTAQDLRDTLSRELRELVEGGVVVWRAYDEHAARSTAVYRQALERRKERGLPALPGLVTGGIGAGGGGGGGSGGGSTGGGRLGSALQSPALQSPAIVEQRRLSTGMPVATSPVVGRTFESLEEVARRGSTSK
jgi:hypothetical protein